MARQVEEEDLDPIKQYVQLLRDDMLWLRAFDLSIPSNDDVKKLQSVAMQYGFSGTIDSKDKSKLVFVVGTLRNIIQKKLDKFVNESIFQRFNEDTIDRLPKEPKQEKSKSPEDSWNV